MADSSEPKQTPRIASHREPGARLVPFAGREMPVQYPTGIITEHQHTRSQACSTSPAWGGFASVARTRRRDGARPARDTAR